MPLNKKFAILGVRLNLRRRLDRRPTDHTTDRPNRPIRLLVALSRLGRGYQHFVRDGVGDLTMPLRECLTVQKQSSMVSTSLRPSPAEFGRRRGLTYDVSEVVYRLVAEAAACSQLLRSRRD